MGMSVPMQSPDSFSDCMCSCTLMFVDDVKVDSFASTITKIKYHQTSISTIVHTQRHLSVKHRNTLPTMLHKHTDMFDGILKVYPHRLVHLDIILNDSPCLLCACLVAHIHLDVFKAELVRLCYIGVLEPGRASQWASPTFIIPQKDESVQWVSEFLELNRVIQQCIYHLPHLQDIL